MLSLGLCWVRTGTCAWFPAPCAAPMAWLGRRRARCGLRAHQGEPRRAGLAVHGGSSPQESSPPAPAVPGTCELCVRPAAPAGGACLPVPRAPRGRLVEQCSDLTAPHLLHVQSSTRSAQAMMLYMHSAAPALGLRAKVPRSWHEPMDVRCRGVTSSLTRIRPGVQTPGRRGCAMRVCGLRARPLVRWPWWAWTTRGRIACTWCV